MRGIFIREIKNYLKQPLFWLGIAVVIAGIYQSIGSYLNIRYLEPGEEIVRDGPEIVSEGETYEGYIPIPETERREIWESETFKILRKDFSMSQDEAKDVLLEMKDMDIQEACQYLEEEYHYYGANYTYEDAAYRKGTTEEINAYLKKVMEEKPFSWYFSRKFADFAGLYMGFFAAMMLSVLFLQDTRKATYELLHTKPIRAGQYVAGKAAGGFFICLMVLGILNLVFWGLSLATAGRGGMEIRLSDFLLATALYILPCMLMIVCVYTCVALLFKNPLPGLPFLLLYIVYSNMGGWNAEGEFGYYGRPLAIMVRFPGELFDIAPPPLVLLNQVFLLLASAGLLLLSVRLWKRRRF